MNKAIELLAEFCRYTYMYVIEGYRWSAHFEILTFQVEQQAISHNFVSVLPVCKFQILNSRTSQSLYKTLD